MNRNALLVLACLAFAGCTTGEYITQPETSNVSRVHVVSSVACKGAIVHFAGTSIDTLVNFSTSHEEFIHRTEFEILPGNYIVVAEAIQQGYENHVFAQNFNDEYESVDIVFRELAGVPAMPSVLLEASRDTVMVGELLEVRVSSENALYGRLSGMGLDVNTISGDYYTLATTSGTHYLSVIVFGVGGVEFTQKVIEVEPRPIPQTEGNIYSAYETVGQIMGETIDLNWCVHNHQDNDLIYVRYHQAPEQAVGNHGQMIVPMNEDTVQEGEFRAQLVLLRDQIETVLDELTITIIEEEDPEPVIVHITVSVNISQWVAAHPADNGVKILINQLVPPMGTIHTEVAVTVRLSSLVNGQAASIGLRDNQQTQWVQTDRPCNIFYPQEGLNGLHVLEGYLEHAYAGQLIVQHASLWPECFVMPPGTGSFNVEGVELTYHVLVH